MKYVLSELRVAWSLLSSPARRTLILYGASLVLLAGLDAGALVLVADLFVGNTTAVRADIGKLAIMIALFIVRTILSTASSWWAVRSMTREETRIGSDNLRIIMSRQLSSSISEADYYNAVDRGPTSLTQGLAMNAVTIIAEVATAVVILGTLLVLDFSTAVASATYFLAVAFVQHRLLSKASARAGEIVAEETTTVYETLNDGYRLRKVMLAMPSVSFEHALEERRSRLATSRGRMAFLGTLPRYTMELVLSIGLVVVSGVAFLVSGEEGTIRAIAIFGVAGFRLLPSINRIQGIILLLFSIVPAARLAHVARSAEPHVSERHISHLLGKDHVVAFQDVTFTYPGSSMAAVNNVSLSLERGYQYAIVGPSGAGKTTFLDLLLGLIHPDEGVILKQSGLQIGYVPQDTHLARIGLSENVALEWASSSIDENRVKEALSKAAIASLVERFSEEGTVHLSDAATSGGQRQRIGMARALYRSPDLLILDEVTSALDAETEHFVMESIKTLRHDCTVVIVAHRLTTVQHADRVIYMDHGEIVGIGTFDELRKTVPQFQRQIELGTLRLSS